MSGNRAHGPEIGENGLIQAEIGGSVAQVRVCAPVSVTDAS